VGARRLLTAGVITLGLSAPAPAAPASAAEPTPAQFAAMGHTSAPSYRLPPGCHEYSYAYRIDPPAPEWILETYITDAAGVAQASDIIMSGADPTSGTKRFQLCASNTAAPGRFTIRAKLTYQHYATIPLLEQSSAYSGWIATSHFQVTRPSTRHPQVRQPSRKCLKARKRARRVETTKARHIAHRVCRRR
jgi:hypothetical protein